MALTGALQHDPNPGFGRVPFLDLAKAVGGLGIVSVQAVLYLLRRVVSRAQQHGSLKLFITRKALSRLPDSVLRQGASLDPILQSTRYGAHAAGFVERVDRPDVSGIWFCTPRRETAVRPAEADVVVLFAHGGGYVIGRPAAFASLQLRVAEAMAARGQTVAVFALDYALAPEHPFPQQLREMTAAWAYLVGELGVAPGKVALMGDSAGGSLCLSFLAHMARPLAAVPPVARPARPGRGLFLLSPWVSLQREDGYAAHADTDLLDAGKLRAWAAAEIQDAPAADVQTYLEFAGARDDWAALLPAYTWVSAGGDELFLHNITAFVTAARAAGCKVDLDVAAGRAHDWQAMEAAQNAGPFLAQAFGTPLDKAAMPGADAIAEAIVAGGPAK